MEKRVPYNTYIMRTSKLVINTQERDLGIAIGISLKDYGIARRQIEY